MIYYNYCSPVKKPLKYNLESFEPIELRPEEKIQNNNLIKLAFTEKSRTNNRINPNIVTIRNIHKISNYNTNNSVTRNLTENNLYNLSNSNNHYSYNNAINENLNKFVSPVKMISISNQKIRKQKIDYHMNQDSNTLLNNYKQHQFNYPSTLAQLTKCKSSKFLFKNLNIEHKNIHINPNNIIIPFQLKQIFPTIAQKNDICNSNQNKIPIYHKIICRRKKIT